MANVKVRLVYIKNMYKFISVFFAFILLLKTAFISCELSKLDEIPQEDRQAFLAYFKKALISDFGFTLIGEKPLALEEFSECFLDQDQDADKAKRRKLFHYLQLIFKNSNKFTLRIIEDVNGPYAAFLINRKLFLEMNEDPDSEFEFETVRIGKLFGYGEENSRFYRRYIYVGRYLRKPPFVMETPIVPEDIETFLYAELLSEFCSVEIPYKNTPPPINPLFSSLEEEWKWIAENKLPFPEGVICPMWIKKPAFVCKKGQETDDLAKKYDLAANKLGKLMHDDNWFELVLKQI